MTDSLMAQRMQRIREDNEKARRELKEKIDRYKEFQAGINEALRDHQGRMHSIREDRKEYPNVDEDEIARKNYQEKVGEGVSEIVISGVSDTDLKNIREGIEKAKKEAGSYGGERRG